MRLLCFPHAGAGASSMNGWASLLPSGIELIRVQLPGREDRAREAPMTRLSQIVDGLIDEVDALLDKPLAFYGHCLGALIAFEVARALRRRGCSLPVGLFVSGRRPPQAGTGTRLFDLPEPQLIEELEHMGASSPLLTDKRWRQYYIANVRNDLEIADTYQYRPEPSLACPIALLIGDSDPLPRIPGWGRQTIAQYEESTFSGGHFFSRTGIEAVVAFISARMATHELVSSTVGT